MKTFSAVFDSSITAGRKQTKFTKARSDVQPIYAVCSRHKTIMKIRLPVNGQYRYSIYNYRLQGLQLVVQL